MLNGIRLIVVLGFYGILWVAQADEDEVPGIYGLSCTMVDSTLFAMGGARAIGEGNLNTAIYQLDMTRLDLPRWKYSGVDIPHPAMYVGSANIPGTSQLLIAGGKNVKLEEGLLSINPLDKKSRFEYLSFPSGLKQPETQQELLFYPYAGGFVPSYNDPTQFLLVGGFFRKNDQTGDTFQDVIFRYDSKRNLWSNVTKTNRGPGRYHMTTTTYGDGIYVIGGMDAKTDAIQPLKTVWRFDLRHGVWEIKNCTGDSVGDRALHSSYRVGKLLYVVGGSDKEFVSNRVDVLDLEALEWKSRPLAGLEGKSQGCLGYYEDKLVYSFGFSPNFLPSPQVIDLDNWALTRYEDPTPMSVILASTAGAVVFLFLITGLGFFWYRRYLVRKAQNEEYQKQYEAHIRSYQQHLYPTTPLPWDSDKEFATIESDLMMFNNTNSDIFPAISHIDHGFVIQEPPMVQKKPDRSLPTFVLNTIQE